MSNQIRLTRDQLAEFLPNPRAIKAFEQVFLEVGTTIPAELADLVQSVEEANIGAESGISKANLALALLSKIETNPTVQVIQGLPGEDGEDGFPGLQGSPGVNGLNGLNGLNGFDGDPGEDGMIGMTGPQGIPGPASPTMLPDVYSDELPDVMTEALLPVSGPAIFEDGSVWSAAGLTDTATYTTASLVAPLNFSYTVNYSNTGGGQTGFLLTPTLTSTGATAGNLSMISFNPTVGNSANNIANARGLILTGAINGSYSGTVSNFNILQLTANSFGTNPVTNLNRILISGTSTNGNGITSGTVTNSMVNLAGDSSAAGAGGTLINYGVNITLSTGSSAGTTNAGILIAGNGGASSTNYAIQSTSTAPSLFTGPVISTVPDDTGASTPTISSASTISPTTPYAFVSGTTTISTITKPGGTTNGCQITLIPTGLWATNTAGNIALATTAVVSKALILTYSASTSKWYPSY